MATKKNAAPAKSVASIETDVTKQKVAQGIFELSLDTDVSEIPDVLIDVAGKKALANLYSFTLADDGDEVRVLVSPVADVDGYERDGLIGAILPKGCRNAGVESAWTFGRGVSVEDAAKRLSEGGFHFDAKDQNRVEKSYTARIEVALGLKKAKPESKAKGEFNKKAPAKKAPAKKAPAKKKPAPKKKNNGGGNFGGGYGGIGGMGGGGCMGSGGFSGRGFGGGF